MDELVTWFRGVLDWQEQLVRKVPSRFPDDDAFMLADIAAKRAVLDAYPPADGYDADRVKLGDWESCSDGCAAEAVRRVVRQLATAYADRPGYREEWRP